MVNSQQDRKEFGAVMWEVHSGDDLILLVDLGVDDLYKKVRVRLKGVDTPDAHKASGSTIAGKVRDRVKQLLSHRDLNIIVHAMKPRGWLVTLFVNTDKDELVNLNDLLASEGFVFKRARAS